MKIWKISFLRDSHLKDTVENLPYCLSHGIVGVGQPRKGVPLWGNGEIFSEYRHYPSEVFAIFSGVAENDLIWTRDHLGVYFLGRILEYSPFVFKKGVKAPEALTAPCRWFRIGTLDSVSQVIVDAFEPYRKIRLIGSQDANLYSRLVYNNQSDNYRYRIFEGAGLDLFRQFTSNDRIDIVALYLQHVYGYRVIPSTFFRSGGTFDFTLSVGSDGSTSVAVKIFDDHETAYTDVFDSYHKPIFIFVPSGKTIGLVPPNLHIISRAQLQVFMIENMEALPLRIGNWVRHYMQSSGMYR